MNYPDIALQVPEVIIPSAEVALDRWAVIACDQYTSEPEYWERVHGDVGDAPSALNLVLPEAHLERPDRNERMPASVDEWRPSWMTGCSNSLSRASS